MIIELFILFTALGLILAITGRIVNYELMLIFGFLIIGLMAFPLINEGLEYRAGVNITTINDNSSQYCYYVQDGEETYYRYGNNYSSYHWDYASPNPSVTEINLFHSFHSYNHTLLCQDAEKQINVIDYETYNNTRWYGIFFLFICLGSLFEYWYRGYGGGKPEE